jgi:hypothetical protein
MVNAALKPAIALARRRATDKPRSRSADVPRPPFARRERAQARQRWLVNSHREFRLPRIGTTFQNVYLLKFSTVSSTRSNFVMLKAVRAGIASRLQLLLRSRVVRRLLRREDGVAAVEFARRAP